MFGTRWYLSDTALLDRLNSLSRGESRRLYEVIELGGQRFFVKTFNEKGIGALFRNLFSPRAKREFLMARRLLGLSIPVPEPIGYGVSLKASFIVERYIDGQDLKEALRRSQRRQILERLAWLVKKLNDSHTLHRDLHLGNIRVREGIPYLLDLHKAQVKRWFSRQDVILNVAQLLHPLWHDMTREEKALFLDRYGEEIEGALERKMGALRRDWTKRKEKRAFRSTSKILLRGRFIIIRGEEERKGKFIELVKSDRKVRIERFEDHLRKYYRSRGRWKRAWKNHVVLLYMGLSVTPRPFYARKPSLFSSAFIAMEDLKGRGEELDRYVDGAFNFLSYGQRRKFIERLSRFFLFLFKNGIYHKDLKACNIFVLTDGTFRLLDVEDISFEELTLRDVKRMLVQLNSSIPTKVSLKDRLRFFVPIARSLGVETRRLFKEIVGESLKREVVYEGSMGLRIERWESEGHR